jgi:hypothetical protein
MLFGRSFSESQAHRLESSGRERQWLDLGYRRCGDRCSAPDAGHFFVSDPVPNTKAALQYVANQKNGTDDKVVASMSIGGSISQSLDDAVSAVIKKGITVAVAAGNDGEDACQDSP